VKSTIHDTTVVNAGRKHGTDPEIKKPFAVFQCIKFMNGIDRADKYLSYYSVLRKTVKWPNVFAELCTLQWALCTKQTQTLKNVQELPARCSKFPDSRSPESKEVEFR
jgi:hypothetical protein